MTISLVSASHPFLPTAVGVGVLEAPVRGRGTSLVERPHAIAGQWFTTPLGTTVDQAIAAARLLASRTGQLSAVLQATDGAGPWVVSLSSKRPSVALGIADSSAHPLNATRSLGSPRAERVAWRTPQGTHEPVPTLALVGTSGVFRFQPNAHWATRQLTPAATPAAFSAKC